MRKLFFILLIFIYTQRSSAQCLSLQLPLEERVNNASYIFEGKLISSECFWDDKHEKIFTAYRLILHKTIKGNYSSPELELIIPGGSLSDTTLEVFPNPALDLGSYGIFLCDSNDIKLRRPQDNGNLPQLKLYGYVQGFVRIQSGNAIDFGKVYSDQEYREVISKLLNLNWKEKSIKLQDRLSGFVPLGGPAISSFYPDTVCAGCDSVLYIRGSGFGSTIGQGSISFKHSSDGGGSWYSNPNSLIKSWTDTLIALSLGEKAGSGVIMLTDSFGQSIVSSEGVFVPYARINSSVDGKQRSTDMRGFFNGGYSFKLSDVMIADSNRLRSFIRALQKWRCNTGVNYSIASGSSSAGPGMDGINTVRYTALQSGVLGLCYSWKVNCTESGQKYPYLAEIDIELANIQYWHYGADPTPSNRIDFENVVLHELGHGHQFEHVCNTSDFMFYMASYGEVNNNFSRGILQGAALVINRAANLSFCSLAPMQPIHNNSCLILPHLEIAANATVCLGSQLELKDSSIGSIHHYIWNFGENANPQQATGSGPHQVSWSSAGTKNIKMITYSDYGKDSVMRTIRVDGTIGDASAIIGDSSGCNTSSIFRIRKIPGAASYLWSAEGASITALNDTSIMVLWDSLSNVLVKVRGINTCDSGDFVIHPYHNKNINYKVKVKDAISTIPAERCSNKQYSFNSQISGFPQKWSISSFSTLNDSSQFISGKWITTGLHKVRHVVYAGCDSIVQEKQINVSERPIYQLVALRIKDSIYFSIEEADSYFWDFGDSSYSTIRKPVHYYKKGNYQVSVIISDFCGVDTLKKELNFLALNSVAEQLISIHPNPFAENTTVHIQSGLLPESLSIFNMLGEKVDEYHWDINTEKLIIERKKLNPGFYMCYIQFRDGSVISRKLVLY